MISNLVVGSPGLIELITSIPLLISMITAVISMYFENKNKNENNGNKLSVFFEKSRIKTKKLTNILLEFLNKIIYTILLVSLIWIGYMFYCVITGDLEVSYAADLSTVLISFLTVFSIIIAFYEFRKK